MTDVGGVVTDQVRSTLVVTLSNPTRRNALTDAMRVGICDSLSSAEADDDIKVLVLTGADGAFCSGADVRELNARAEKRNTEDVLVDMAGHPERSGRPGGFDFPLLFWDFPKPTIAAVNGPAVGAGFGLMMCCDLRLASSSASACAAFGRMGLSCEYGLSFLLPRLVGPAQALEILYTARRFEADEMLAMGLVNRVVPDAELMDQTMALADEIGRIPAGALRRIRTGVKRGMVATDYRHQIEYEAYLQSLGLAGDDHRDATRLAMSGAQAGRRETRA